MATSYQEVVPFYGSHNGFYRLDHRNRAGQALEPLTNKWPKGCLGWVGSGDDRSKARHKSHPHGSHGTLEVEQLAPEKWGLEDYFPFLLGLGNFSGAMLNFRRVKNQHTPLWKLT